MDYQLLGIRVELATFTSPTRMGGAQTLLSHATGKAAQTSRTHHHVQVILTAVLMVSRLSGSIRV